MTTIGPTFPAHIAVSQAEVRLVADQTANADASMIKPRPTEPANRRTDRARSSKIIGARY